MNLITPQRKNFKFSHFLINLLPQIINLSTLDYFARHVSLSFPLFWHRFGLVVILAPLFWKAFLCMYVWMHPQEDKTRNLILTLQITQTQTLTQVLQIEDITRPRVLKCLWRVSEWSLKRTGRRLEREAARDDLSPSSSLGPRVKMALRLCLGWHRGCLRKLLKGDPFRNLILKRRLCYVKSYTPRRSFLYIPGNEERKVSKATGLNADCVVLDCEDGVAVNKKAQPYLLFLFAGTNSSFIKLWYYAKVD